MTMPFYASAEQIMRDRSEYARKNVARGRGVVALKYPGGVLFVADNASRSLHKLGELYDRVGFAGAGRYNEFESLRVAGVRYADVWGYSNSRRDVSGQAIANMYAANLGAIFTEQQKPFEVEICVAEVGPSADEDQLYRLTYDGSIVEEPQFAAMGGESDAISERLRSAYQPETTIEAGLRMAVDALSAGRRDAAALQARDLEVAVLDRTRALRCFRRIPTSELTDLLPSAPPEADSGRSPEPEA
ncbi:MAG: proteasome subunit alpha [Mycobacteriales bacterium]